MSLETVYSEFSQRLSPLGRVVIAGGAVRDSLMGKQPKDWDIFCLMGERFDAKKLKDQFASSIADLMPVESIVSWHLSEPYLAATVRWEGSDVQILGSPQPNMEALVGTFDWNVCLFGYDGSYLQRTPLGDIVPGKPLKLNTVTFPLSTLRRGFRFSERFSMDLPKETVVELCRQIADKADKQQNTGPQGNEPDMPALAANALVENAA